MGKINASMGMSAVALAGVILLGVLQFSQKPGSPHPAGALTASDSAAGPFVRIAFVNIDSFEAQYTYLLDKRAELQKKQESMKSELQRSAIQMQKDVNEVQRKAQAGTLTQSEYENAEKRIGQMQQSLQAREAALTEQLFEEQDKFNSELKSRLDDFLAEYNQIHGFDYILTYSAAGPILLANPSLDITRDVIDGMNARAEKESKAKEKKNP